MHICFHSWAVAFVCRGGICLWAVAFVCGQLHLFLSGLEQLRSFLSIHICSWAVVTLARCGGGGPLAGGGGGCSL